MNFFITVREIASDHLRYRQQILKLAKADIIRTYRGASLGPLWALIKPSFTIFIYWFVFSVGIRKNAGGIDGVPFFYWLLAGIVPWFYMSDMLQAGTRAIKKHSYLVTKMKFPIATIPTFVSLSNLAVHLGLVLLTLGIFWCSGYAPNIYWLQLPFYTLCMYLLFTSFCLLCSLVSAISPDIANLIRALITPIFWLSGIVWNVSEQTGLLKTFFHINPVTFLSYGYRNALTTHVWFFEQPKRLLYFGVFLFVTMVLSLFFYRKLRKEIPDVL